MKFSIDIWRKIHLSLAEMIDAWRVIPRVLVAGYGFLMFQVITWYMKLQPYMIEGCDVELLREQCIANAPSTQHAALVTAVVGIAAAVFGLYASSGRKWDKFIPWKTE